MELELVPFHRLANMENNWESRHNGIPWTYRKWAKRTQLNPKHVTVTKQWDFSMCAWNLLDFKLGVQTIICHPITAGRFTGENAFGWHLGGEELVYECYRFLYEPLPIHQRVNMSSITAKGQSLNKEDKRGSLTWIHRFSAAVSTLKLTAKISNKTAWVQI